MECLRLNQEINNIFGYDLFSGSPTTFAQSTNIPVPSNYIIGAGDELIFQFFGSKNQKNLLVVVSTKGLRHLKLKDLLLF
mgnify:CR=1 FL=1